MSCAAPIDAAVLADYWLAELPPAEESLVEEHLFACAHCSRAGTKASHRREGWSMP